MDKHCCFKSCDDLTVLDARVEVKTVLPPKHTFRTFQDKCLIKWKSNGEAEFHTECWQKLLSSKKSRSKKQYPCMTKEEKRLVKIAAEAPEQFDSLEKLKTEAKQAAKWIKQANHLVVFTGAGISTSAGIGDYRGKAGKWTEEDQNKASSTSAMFDPMDSSEPPNKKVKTDKDVTDDQTDFDSESGEDDDGVPYEKLRPTYTHEALNKLRESGYLKYIISQNGDGLHTLSGIPASQIAELHGNVFVEVCEKCERQYHRSYYVMDDVGSQYFEDIEDYGKSSVKKPKHSKKCELCGLSHRTSRKCESKGCKGYLRDTIINFRDLLDESILDKAWEMANKCDVMLCLGTTLKVTPACDLVMDTKKGCKLIICNRQETPVDDRFETRAGTKTPAGCRVFGDCDVFIQEVMSHIYKPEVLNQWQAGRAQRMLTYDELRD